MNRKYWNFAVYNCNGIYLGTSGDNFNSISDLHNNDFNLYPNPAEDIIHFEIGEKIDLMALYDLSGQELRTFKILQDNQIDIGDLKSGVYILQVFFNEEMLTTKIIKK